MAKHDDGSGVVSYDSFEEMLEDQRRAHEAAMENMTASQRAIPLGGYALNLSHMDGKDGPPIFGCIQSPEEVAAWHRLYYGIGTPAELEAARVVLAERGEFDPPNYPKDPAGEGWKEDGYATGEEAIQTVVTDHIDSWTNGYLFGKWLSAWEPEGELGSAHASVCVEVSERCWLEAKEHGGYISEASAEEVAQAIRVVRAEIKAREGEPEGEGDDDSDVNRG